MNCSICKNKIYTEHGHNAQPINNGRCCDTCNLMYVVPTRMKQQFERECG